jgi:PrcB C-terminal
VTRRLAPLAAGGALLAATAAVAASPPRSIPFRTVAKDAGASSSLTERGVRVVRDRRSWARVWRRLKSGELPRQTPPSVDFSRRMLIVVTQGRQPSGGYSVRIRAIADNGTRLVVDAREYEPARHCITPQVVTAPYHVVRVRRTPKPVAAERRRVVVDC